MNLLLVSDLHTEFYRDPLPVVRKAVPPAWTPGNLDFLALVGDIVVPSRQSAGHVRQIFEYLGQRARHVLYVEGNHEYYGCESASDVEESLRSSLPANCHWLSNSEATIDGVHFFGGTLWFNNADQMDFYHQQYLNDFSQIGGFTDWVYERSRHFTEQALVIVRPETVVLSHHLPHPKSTAEQYKNSTLNRFFTCDQTQVITEKQPRLWVHGHTHLPCDYALGGTRVICNPYGYPQERGSAEYPQVVVEV
jgi:Icc-related predicted phosphoesterase